MVIDRHAFHGRGTQVVDGADETKRRPTEKLHDSVVSHRWASLRTYTNRSLQVYRGSNGRIMRLCHQQVNGLLRQMTTCF
jgi:hypothetical protein